MFVVIIVALLLLVTATLLLPLAFLLSFGPGRRDQWTWWGRLILLALAGLCAMPLVIVTRSADFAWDIGEFCARKLGYGADELSVTARNRWFPVSSVCSAPDGNSVELIPWFVNPVLAVCLVVLPVLVGGAVRTRRRRPQGWVAAQRAERPPAPWLGWLAGAAGLLTVLLALLGFVVFAPAVGLLAVGCEVLRRRRSTAQR